MPKITVIIPTFNREAFVARAIDSALTQSFTDHEIIVIDDGSTDDTRFALKRFGSRIRYVPQEHAGVSAARNAGVRSATGEWVAFLDSDDEWKPEYLASQVGRVEGSEICMQTTDCCFIGLNGETSSYFATNGSLPEFKGEEYLRVQQPFSFIVRHGPWQIGSTIIRRAALERAGLFDTSVTLSEDLDLMARVALQGGFGMIRKQLVNIYRRAESIECLTLYASANPVWARKSDDRIYEKLKRIKGLRRRERQAVSEVMSANRRALGNLLLEKGQIEEAGEWYKRALASYPSLRSLGKYVQFIVSH